MVDYVGDTLTYDIYVVSTVLAPLTGESPVLSEGFGPSEQHGFHVSELGGGYYRISSNPALEAGPYRAVVTFRTVGDPDYQQLSITWDVDPSPTEDSISITLGAANGTSLAEIRRRVARSLRDYRRAVATSPGSTTTLVDIFNLVNNTDYYRGAEIVCVTGHPENIGKKRKVVSSAYETGTATFIPPLPQPTQVGDVFDMYRFARVPFMIQEYDDAINDAIAAAWPANRVRALVVPVEPFDRATGYFSIPDQVRGVYGVAYAREGDYLSWPRVEQAKYPHDAGWYVDTASRQITFGGATDFLNARQLALYSYVQPGPLTSDNSLTTTEPEWLVDQVAGILLKSAMDQTTFAIGQERANRADQLRAKMATPSEVSTIWIG